MGYLRTTLVPSSGLSGISQRNVLNVSYSNDVAHYIYINHVLEADNWVSPNGAAYNSVNPSWPELLDQTTGYPNNATASGHDFGGGLKFPDSSKFNGPYVITWDGAGTLYMGSGTWTESNNTGTTYTKVSNGKWTNVAGQTAYIVATLSGWGGAPAIMGVYISATGGTGGFVRNVRIYRQADETDLLAGKIFRTAYKQQIVDHAPSALRVMNWTGGNNNHGMRWENRILPTAASYAGDGGATAASSWISSPLYGTTTGVNQFVLPLVTTGVRQTPASMQHGEIAICRIGNKPVGGQAWGLGMPVIVSITKAATPRVVTATAHGFTTGQKVYHMIPAGNGMTNLNRFPVTVSVVNTTTYDITSFNSTSETTYVANSGNVIIYLSLNVGARGEYPIVFPPGDQMPGFYGDDGNGSYFPVPALKTFYFDKNITGKSDGAGNLVKGVWIFTSDGYINGHFDAAPVEILTKLILELNQMSAKPIHMWVCTPHRGLLSIDPDYSAGSNWAVQATGVILNGNTVGSVTYPGLKTMPTINLYIEYSNEIWNQGPHQGYYMRNYSNSRWGVIQKPDAYALRATCQARDIKTAYPSESQIKYVMGMWGATGMAPGDYAGNYESWNGSSTPGGTGNYYSTDSAVVAGSWGAPKNWFDAVAIAPYFDAGPTYYDASGAGSFADDSALYNGTGAHAGAPNQSQAIANFVNAAKTATDASHSLDLWLTMQDQFISNMGANQVVIHYEGGPNWDPTAGAFANDPPGYTRGPFTAAEAAFLTAVYRSSQLGTAMVNYFNSVSAKSKSAMPAVYLSVNVGQRWSFAAPDSYATGSSVEGSNLTSNPAWAALNARNAGIT